MLPLKTATVQDDYAWVWSEDDALDHERKDFATEYKAALDSSDMERMPLLPGVKPTVFWLRHPSPVMRRWFAGLWSDSSRSSFALRRIAQLSIAKVENAGVDLKWQSTDPETKAPCVPEATMDVLEGVRNGALVDAIALAVLNGMKSPS